MYDAGLALHMSAVNKAADTTASDSDKYALYQRVAIAYVHLTGCKAKLSAEVCNTLPCACDAAVGSLARSCVR